jgi:hypothetical protein
LCCNTCWLGTCPEHGCPVGELTRQVGRAVAWPSTQTQVGFQGGELSMLGVVILWTWYLRVSANRLLVITAYPRTVLTMFGAELCLILAALF